MSDTGKHNIVFVIKPYTGDKCMQPQWCKDIKLAIVKLLWHFALSSPLNLEYAEHISACVKWAYRFMGARTGRTAGQEWKDLGLPELSSFAQDMDQFTNPVEDAENVPESEACSVVDELMSIVHDYNWETSYEISPLKRRKGLPSKQRNKSTSHAVPNLGIDCLSKLISEEENRPQNIVILLLPVPSSQEEMYTYFDHYIINENGDVPHKLLPPHLHQHFQEKFGISISWIDTAVVQNSRTAPGPTHDITFRTIIKDFVRSMNGNVIPLSLLSGNAASSINAICGDMTSAKQTHLTTVIPSTALLETLRIAVDSPNTEDASSHLVHVCQKETDTLHGVKKLCTISIDERCSNVDLDIFNQVCQLHPKSELDNKSLSSDVCEVKSSTSGTDLYIVKNTERMGHGCKSRPETVFVLSGSLPLARLPLLLENRNLEGLAPVWCDMKNLNAHLDPHKLENSVLVAKIHKYCVACCQEPFIENYNSSRHVLLKSIGKNLAVVIFLRSKSSEILTLIECEPPQPSNNSTTLSHLAGDPIACTAKTTEDLVNSEPSAFQPAMLEKWWRMFGEGSLGKILDITQSKSASEDFLPRDIISSLQDHYANEGKKLTEKIKENAVDLFCEDIPPLESCTNGNTLSSAVGDYQKILETSVNSSATPDTISATCDYFLHSTRSILSDIFQYCDHGNTNEGALDIINREFILTIKELKALDGQEQGSLLIMQVLLRMEIAKNFPCKNESHEIMEEVASLLRKIALSIGPGVMAAFLQHPLLSNYESDCGKLLYDVHNELMRPIPQCLEQYSEDESELTGDILSVPSLSSRQSLTGSIRSSLSCNGLDYNSRNKRRGMHSSIRCQIAVPGPKRGVLTVSSSQEDGVHSRTRSSTKKKKIEKDPGLNKKKVRRIRRDLFSSMDDEDRSTALPKSPTDTTQKRLIVSDTPNVKQRMTALSRQRLRLRKEKETKPDKDALTMVEESPAKLEDVQLLRGTDIAKANTTLTRRHSFYCSGTESRSVARATIIHRHQEAVPATPEISRNRKLVESPRIQPSGNIIFKQAGTPDRISQSGLQMSPVMRGSSKRSGNPNRRNATKALFQSPVKEEELMIDIPETTSNIPFKDTAMNKFNCEDFETVLGDSNLKIHPKPRQSPRLRKLVIRDATNENETSENVFLEDDDHHGLSAAMDKSALKCHNRSFSGEKTSSGFRKPAQVEPDTDGKDVMSQMSLDSFVIRTPGGNSTRTTSDKSREKRKRKFSQDNTPTRDDINQWPRKKRGVDKSSPGVVSKRKKLFNACDEDLAKAAFQTMT